MSALTGFDIVVLACGPSIEAGQSRMAILEKSARIFGEVVPEVMRYAPDALLVVASNPVDVMTHVTAAIAGVAADRVIGTGTILDTLRFRAQLALHLGIAPASVHADVLGEHGDSEVLAWSAARVGGLPLLAVAGIALGAAIGSWVNFTLLSTHLQRDLGVLLQGAARAALARVLLCTAVAAALAAALRVVTSGWHRLVEGPIVLAAFSLVYLLSSWWWGSAEAARWLRLSPRRREGA
jgi:hypothetical protein